ncbi:MAG: serine kinase [Anaerolineae bacterium]|nr:serine kinase [Anaerolineae bacterium]
MKVHEIVQALSLEVLAGASLLDRPVTGGYASDLLSRVLAAAKAGNVWVTLQNHPNVVAVASLLDLAAVIVTEGPEVGPETVARAQEHGVVLLRTPHDTFTIVARLAEMGVEGVR